MERDFYMSAAEAVEYGLADKLMESGKHAQVKKA
jgi:ATP-dependent protease ClpP protease subunit